jgi:hypothetical protein
VPDSGGAWLGGGACRLDGGAECLTPVVGGTRQGRSGRQTASRVCSKEQTVSRVCSKERSARNVAFEIPIYALAWSIQGRSGRQKASRVHRSRSTSSSMTSSRVRTPEHHPEPRYVLPIPPCPSPSPFPSPFPRPYRGTSLIRNEPPLGPYSRPMPRAL